MNLNNFDDNIDSTILGRGYDYFLDQAVTHLEDMKFGTWASLVEGNQDYSVVIKLDNDEIKEWSCNCPYERGPICKHVVATLYAIGDDQEIKSKSKKKAKKKAVKKSKTKEIFSKVNKRELQDFLQKQFDANHGIKNAFIAYFAEYLDEDINKKYQITVRNIHKAATDRHDFIDYRSTYKLADPINDLISKAYDLASNNNVAHALAICKAVIEQVPNFMHNVDDSDGSTGSLFEDAFDLLYEISENAHLELKDELFSYCLKEFPKEKYSDFCLEGHFLNILPLLVSSSKQEKQFFKVIDKQLIKAESKRNSSYDIVQLIQVKIDYLLLKGREDEIQVLVNENKQYPEFRKILMQQALDNENFKLAKELCEQGIFFAKDNGHLGVVNKWRKRLLKIAELEKNKPDIRKWAEILYNDNYRDMDYYKKLKSTYSTQDWKIKCESIIDQIKGRNQYGGYGLAEELADIFIAEKYFDRLLALLQINPTKIDLIDRYAQHLIKKHPKEIIDLYSTGIKKQAEQTGRPIYNQTVTHMKIMSSIPESQLKLNDLIRFFKAQYKNRRAMMEILNKSFPNQFKVL